MEVLLVVALVVVVWFIVRRSKASSPVADSALDALRREDALLTDAWTILEQTVDGSENFEELARAILENRRGDLPENVDALWTRIDELTARVNRAVQHYEVVSGSPGPPLESEEARVRAMGAVRLLAKQ